MLIGHTRSASQQWRTHGPFCFNSLSPPTNTCVNHWLLLRKPLGCPVSEHGNLSPFKNSFLVNAYLISWAIHYLSNAWCIQGKGKGLLFLHVPCFKFVWPARLTTHHLYSIYPPHQCAIHHVKFQWYAIRISVPFRYIHAPFIHQSNSLLQRLLASSYVTGGAFMCVHSQWNSMHTYHPPHAQSATVKCLYEPWPGQYSDLYPDKYLGMWSHIN